MQGVTGCKINVSQPQQPDIQRQIGLVGSRAAIEEAKRAIYEKVETVVSTRSRSHNCPRQPTNCPSNNVTVKVVAEIEVLVSVMTEATVTNTHNHSSNSTDSLKWVALRKACQVCPRCLQWAVCPAWLNQVLLLPQAVIQMLLTRMLRMVATTTTWRCGTLPLPNKVKEVARASSLLCLSKESIA